MCVFRNPRPITRAVSVGPAREQRYAKMKARKARALIVDCKLCLSRVRAKSVRSPPRNEDAEAENEPIRQAAGSSSCSRCGWENRWRDWSPRPRGRYLVPSLDVVNLNHTNAACPIAARDDCSVEARRKPGEKCRLQLVAWGKARRLYRVLLRIFPVIVRLHERPISVS